MTHKSLSLDAALDLLALAERPTILSHARPDGDAIGSTVALACLFEALGKRAAFVCESPCPRRLSFLLEGAPLLLPEENAGGAVFAVDVASRAQLGGIADAYAARVCLSIDHHASCTPFAPTLLDPDAAAAGEIIYLLGARALERGLVSALPEGFADAAYAAISSDTGCFRYANATQRTHEIAAALLRAGARADHINHLLFESRTEKELQADAIATRSLRLYEGGRVGAVTLSQADREGFSDEHFESVINIPRSVAGVEIALSVREMAGGVCRVSLRSTGADVASVAAAFGGGGHLRAAGCTVNGTPEQALAAVLPLLAAALAK